MCSHHPLRLLTCKEEPLFMRGVPKKIIKLIKLLLVRHRKIAQSQLYVRGALNYACVIRRLILPSAAEKHSSAKNFYFCRYVAQIN